MRTIPLGQVVCGDALEVLRDWPDGAVHAVITDPPYGLHFMGAAWDKFGAGVGDHRKSRERSGSMHAGEYDHRRNGEYQETMHAIFAEALRVLKPGGHALVFGGPRTFHRLACAIEDAGFEIRDCVGWLFGQGFPKSHNLHGAWEGWGTALKPGHEIIINAVKPLLAAEQLDMIGSHLSILEGRLWSLLPASIAESLFALSPSEYGAACASARWNADEQRNIQAGLSEAMDMSRFVLATISSLNTVLSWRDILTGLSRDGNTFITGTGTSPTIDWRILTSCLSAITPVDIILAHAPGRFSPAHANVAVVLFNADITRLRATHERSVTAPVIERLLADSQDVDGTVHLEFLCVARKPLGHRAGTPGGTKAGRMTVAENVEAHGTGALNVDGCRLDTVGRKPGNTKSLGKLKHGYNGSTIRTEYIPDARWPANVAHDGSAEVMERFAEFGDRPSSAGMVDYHSDRVKFGGGKPSLGFGDSGTAARFFYCGKAVRGEIGRAHV